MIGRGPIAGALILAATTLAACDRTKTFDPRSQIGANPVLPAPRQYLVPPIRVAEIDRWTGDQHPRVADGLAITAMSRDLHRPRQPYVLPNGDILVVESRGPGLVPTTRPKDPLVEWFQKRSALQGGKPDNRPTNRVTLLRDSDGDGRADLQIVLLDELFSPFGIAWADDTLYIANTDAIVAYPYRLGDTRIGGPARTLTDLPGGPIDYHWTKSLALSPDGRLLYVGVGSNSNVGEHGMLAERDRAAIWEVERATGRKRLFASGMRNPNGLTFYPGTDTLWAVVNERDELGPDLVPDYMTSVRDGGFYGWPYSYYGNHLDPRVMPLRPDLVARAIKPDYALGSHVAALGLAFTGSPAFPPAYRNGAFVGQHGSWNRDRFSGYKVVFIPFAGGRPDGLPREVVTGFLTPDGKARGRPVGLAVDAAGGLLIADDTGNTLWRVAAKRSPAR